MSVCIQLVVKVKEGEGQLGNGTRATLESSAAPTCMRYEIRPRERMTRDVVRGARAANPCACGKALFEPETRLTSSQFWGFDDAQSL